MKKVDETVTTRYFRAPTGANRFFALLLIVSLIGSAAGSCISYGHSCWGAHGKRSYNRPRVAQHRQIDTRENVHPFAQVETDGNPVGNVGRNHWFLSRLITGRLEIPPATTVVDKRSGNRWQKEQNIFALPENWNVDYDTTRNDLVRSDQSVDGNEMAETSLSMEDSKDLVDPIALTPKIEKPDDETTKLLFVQEAQKAYDIHHPSRPRELRLYKILTDSSDDTLK